MAERENFNAEYLNTNGGDFEEIKKYCTEHYCYTPNVFTPYGKPCASNRDGKCMMAEFMKKLYVR